MVLTKLGGASVGAFTAIGSSGFGVSRFVLGAGNAGAHTLTSTACRNSGDGQYPGGSDLK